MSEYTVICYRGSEATAQLVSVAAPSAPQAYAKLGALGYTPAAIRSIQRLNM